MKGRDRIKVAALIADQNMAAVTENGERVILSTDPDFDMIIIKNIFSL